MAQRHLTLVRAGGDRRDPGGGALAAAVLGAFAVVCTGLATLSGADAARSAIDPRTEARAISDRALDTGYRAPLVVQDIRGIRAELGRSPLSALRRVVYADLLLALSRSPEDTPAAAFHASLAAELAPVTVPVVRGSVVVLVRCGRIREALDLVSRMFAYDCVAAAELLAEQLPLVGPELAGSAVPPIPAAHVAWSIHLRGLGDRDRADEVLERAAGRWPADVAVMRAVADRAVVARDWDRLGRVLDGIDLPTDRTVAPLFTHRCRLAASRGDFALARDDLETALRLGGDWPETLRAAGDCEVVLGDRAAARDLWRSALYRIDGPSPVLRASLWQRIAELDEREGRASDALRAWRQVLRFDPDHARADRRVRELGGDRER